MKRIVVAFALGAFIVAAPVTAKVVTVTNPMGADLDGAGHDIFGVANYQTSAGAILGGDSVLAHVVTLSVDRPMAGPFLAVIAGTWDPLTEAPEGNLPVATLYQRRVDADHGELWFKVGPAATDWQRIAP